MRRAASISALALAALAIGCGGGGESDDERVRSTLETFGSATVDEDFGEACDQLTDKARERLAAAGPVLGGKGCEGTLKAGIAQLDEAEVDEQFGDLKISGVKVDGDSATAKVQGETTRLVKVDDEWRIDVSPE